MHVTFTGGITVDQIDLQQRKDYGMRTKWVATWFVRAIGNLEAMSCLTWEGLELIIFELQLSVEIITLVGNEMYNL